MSVGEVKKASLWREGFHNFQTNWREWAPLAFAFYFIVMAGMVFSHNAMEPFNDSLKNMAGSKDPKAALALLNSIWTPKLAIFSVIFTLAMYVKLYVFTGFFMKKELPAETAAPTVREFFCFVSKNIQLVLVAMLPGILVGALMVVLQIAGLKSGVFLALAVVILVVSMFYLLTRYCLTVSLAAGKIKAPLKNSWHLTHKNCWRLVGNYIILSLIFLATFVLYLVVLFIIGFLIAMIAKPLGVDITLATAIVKYIAASAYDIVMMGIICAYTASVCRVLYREKQVVDPTFILTTRA